MKSNEENDPRSDDSIELKELRLSLKNIMKLWMGFEHLTLTASVML